MDVFGIGFIVMMCILGGIIAVVADNLGRTLGKKRLSVKSRFLKLRPRRTAQVFTFGAGVLIPLLTLVAVMTLSADVRQWFVEGPDLIRQRNDLTKEVEDRRAELRELGIQNEQTRVELTGKTAELARLTQRGKELSAKLATYERQVSQLTIRAAQLNRRTEQLTREAALLSKQIAEKTREAVLLAEKVSVQQKEYQRLKSSFDQLSDEIKASYEENIEIQRENVELTRANDDLKGQITGLKSSIGDLTKEFDSRRKELENNLAAKQRELELTALELDKRRGELQRADLQLQQVGALALASRRFPMVYRLGEEIARLQVPANLSRNAAIDHITRLVRSSRTEAESKGAKGRGTFPSAGIMDRLDPENDTIISADQQLERIVNRITGLSEELVLIATSSVNSFLGEPVSLDIQSYRNPVVFTAGEMVAEGRIDGERSEEFIVEEIMEFVRNDVRKRAQEEGMVPILGMDRGYGEMPQNTLIALMRSARANNRRVRLQAFAPKDIRAGDPLVLDYRIR